MTTRALIYGGIQITGIVTRTSSTYDGICIEHRGNTLMRDGTRQNAGMTIEMNPHEALDLALCLIRSVEKHGQDSQKSAKVLIKRLAKGCAKASAAIQAQQVKAGPC